VVIARVRIRQKEGEERSESILKLNLVYPSMCLRAVLEGELE
jgi:hypothetical protein